MARFLIAGALVGAAAADTLTSCGSDSDHLKITSITTDADATGGPKKGKPFTITVEGTFDEAHQHGVVSGNLKLKALGIVNEEIPFDQKYDFLPGLAAGASKVTIGPITFPKSVPGEVDVTGKITIANEKAEQVTCLDLNLKIPKLIAAADEQAAAPCGDMSKDHIQNIVSNTVNNITTTTMDLDEDFGYVNVIASVSVKAPIVPAVGLSINVPIALSPAIPAGQLKFVGYPDESSTDGPNDILKVTGSVKLNDQNGEEYTCIPLGDSADAVVV